MTRTATTPFLATLATAFLVLTAGAASAGKNPPAPKPPKVTTSKVTSAQIAAWQKNLATWQKDNPAYKAAKAQLALGEATVLRDAYILLAAANADYDGHRGHAMGAISSAVYHLDHKVLANGTAAQQQAIAIQVNATARARVLDQYIYAAGAGAYKQYQALSDRELYAAAQLLTLTRPTLIKNNQAYTLGKVDYAIREIAIALLIR